MKPLSGEILKLEIRITPYDQQPICIDEKDLQMFDVIVLCEEGSPNGTPKLHYHGYIETPKSQTWLRSYLRKLAHAPDNIKVNGNALFFTKQPHEHTFGYIVKSNNVVTRHGVTQETIDEWLTKSNEYKKNIESDRKRKQRERDEELMLVYNQIKKGLHDGTVNRNVPAIIDAFIAKCATQEIRFPAKTQMESFVLRLIYPYDDWIVRSYYQKSFSNL